MISPPVERKIKITDEIIAIIQLPKLLLGAIVKPVIYRYLRISVSRY